MGLTFRSDKGSPLTHTELDNNFREFFYSGSIRGSELVLHRSRSLDTELTLPLNSPVGEDYSIQFKTGIPQSGSGVAFTGSGDLLHDYRQRRTVITGSLFVTASNNIYAIKASGSLLADSINTNVVSASAGLVIGTYSSITDQYKLNNTSNSGPYIRLLGANDQTASSHIFFADSQIEPLPSNKGLGIRYDSSNEILFIDSYENEDTRLPVFKFRRTGESEAVNNFIAQNEVSVLGNITASQNITTNTLTVVNSLEGSSFNFSGNGNIVGDLTVQGTGSFAVFQTVNSEELNVGSNFLTLNYNSPSVPNAGIRTIDSGSTTTTASLFFDSSTNDWKYDYNIGVDHQGGVVLMGPEGTGSYTNFPYNAEDRLVKGTGGHHLNDSNISDNGTLITLSGTTVNVTATNFQLQGTTVNQNIKTLSLPASTTISSFGKSLVDDTSATAARTTLGLGSISTLNSIDISAHTNLAAGTGITLTDDTLSVNTSGVSLGGDLSGTAASATVARVNGVAITAAEASQLANINSSTISSTQWGYVGNMNQNVTSTSNVSFNIIQPAVGSSNGIRWVAGYGGYGGADNATITWDRTDGGEDGQLEINVGDDSNDNIYLNAAGGTDVANDLRVTGDVVAYYSSDERLKDNIVKLENPIEKIKKLNGVEFDWNDNQDTYKGHDIGVIAQEVEKVLPELVTTRDNGYKAVRYEKIVALLIEAIKDQQSQIDELKSKL